MRLFSILLAAMATLSLGVAHARASLVVNGSFDDYQGNLANSYYEHVANGTAPGANPVLPGWGVGFGPLANATTSGVDVVRASVAPAAAPAADGNQYLDLNGTPGPGNIYQTLNTVPGQEYVLRFSYAATVDGAAALYSVWDQDLNGTQLVPFLVAAPSPANPLQWVYTQVAFVAQSNSTLIGFGQFSPPSGNVGVYIDDVSVNAVPEPAAIVVWALFGVCGTGLAFVRHRRKVA